MEAATPTAAYGPLEAEAAPARDAGATAEAAEAWPRAGRVASRACGCAVALSFVSFVGFVVLLQCDLARMTILSRDDLAAVSADPNATVGSLADEARDKASFVYSWLVHRTPRTLVPWEGMVGEERPWMNESDPTYAHGHCDGRRLLALVQGDADERCGPWARKRKGCAAGYFEAPAGGGAGGGAPEDEEPTPCPAGMFCPEGFTCFVACLYGAACPASTWDAALGTCAWPVHLKHTPSARGYRGADGAVRCPGVAFETLAPAGWYAPDPTVDPVPCPARHYCREGSYEPQRCPFVATCDAERLEAPDVSVAAAAAFLGCSFVCFAVYHSSQLVRHELRRLRDRQRERLAGGLDAILDRRAARFAGPLLGEGGGGSGGGGGGRGVGGESIGSPPLTFIHSFIH